MKKRTAIFLIAFFAPFFIATLPTPKGFVTDDAGVMRPETVQKLDSYLTSLEAQTGVEIAIVTVKSLDGDVIDNYAVALFKAFGSGKKGKDNGALFLIAPNERQLRIEVAYGLEGAVNDATAGRILDTYAIPNFKAGDIDLGIESATAALVAVIVERENLTFNPSEKISVQKPDDEGSGLGFLGKLFILLILGYLFIRHPWIFLFFLSSYGGGGRSSGGFGGGNSFGGFGGGMSGGGGASRGW